MSADIILTLLIVFVAAVLFITEWLRADVVALLILITLAVTGLVTPGEAVSGFSNPAVITVWAMFIISGGLAATGVANAIGERMMQIADSGETRLLIVIMLTAAILSAFMNNVGVAALMLPVVVAIARETKRPPSHLLMPLAFACLLGGLMTLIGTPPNILSSDALREVGLTPFGLFDFVPIGVPIMLTGVLVIALTSRYLLPTRDLVAETAVPQPNELYNLQERLFVARIPEDSQLAGKSLAESRLGDVLGVNVLGIIDHRHTQLAPQATAVLHSGDRLIVIGRREHVAALQQYQLDVAPAVATLPTSITDFETAVLVLMPGSNLIGKSLENTHFRQQFGVNVLAIKRDNTIQSKDLAQLMLKAQDELIIQASPAQVANLAAQPDFTQTAGESAEFFKMNAKMLLLRIPPQSALVGQTLATSNLHAVMGLTVLGRLQDEKLEPLSATEDLLNAGDILLVQGTASDLAALSKLSTLEIDQTALDIEEIQSEKVGLVQATLSPYTAVAGKTLREIHFREKFGMTVIAIWRAGRPYRHDLAEMPLRKGDGFLLYGPRASRPVLAAEPDFILLETVDQRPLKTQKAPIALFIMALVLIPVFFNWISIAISAVLGAVLMVVTRCLSMDEAYRQIEWKAVFLIAGMLPLGIAMQTSGTAAFLAQSVVTAVGPWGVLAVLAGLFLLTNISSQIMPNAVVVVLMAPIALNTAADLNVSPYTFMMAIAIAASISFLSPVGHPANVLVMGPGGYRFVDYIKLGLPLTMVAFIIAMLLLPIFWPLQ